MPKSSSITTRDGAHPGATTRSASPYCSRVRAVATRYNKLAVRYDATPHIAAIGEWLRPLTS